MFRQHARQISQLMPALCIGLLLGCASQPPAVLPEGWVPELSQLIPADVDLVARIDLAKARHIGVDEVIRKGIAASGLSPAVVEALSGC